MSKYDEETKTLEDALYEKHAKRLAIAREEQIRQLADSSEFDKKHEDQYIADWRQNQEIQSAEDWDEETPNEKRRSMFYAINKIAIVEMTETVIMEHEGYYKSKCIDIAALIISEICIRSNDQYHLKPGDPEFGDATCIDEA